MAASDEFPRGWHLSASGNNGAVVSIVVPAVPGVAHVLTDIIARVNGQGAIYSQAITVNTILQGELELQAPAAGTVANPVIIEASMTGVKIMGVVGAALTVAFNGNIAGSYERLAISGYDV